MTVAVNGGGTIVFYEPQVRSWPNFTQLAGTAAVAVTLPGASAPVYGTLTFTSLASADVPSGMLSLVNSAIDAFSWPTAAPADAPALTAFVKTNLHLAGKPMVPLALALASIPKRDRPRTTPVRANPPLIYVSKTPAVLVAYDGKPVFSPITGTVLEYAVNANSEVVHDASANRYYVRIKSGWYSSTAIAGPYAQTAAPASFAAIPASGPWIHALAQPPATSAPRFIVSMVPSALIDIAGDPQFASIPGTQLRYVSNTSSDLFFSRQTTVWYVLLSGRWFRAANLNGPWKFTSRQLPKDFAKIPESSPRGRVLVSVPGTTQAFYAASVAQVQHVTAVDAATANLTVTYEGGTPSFQAIAGTPLQYATNADADVIEVSSTQYVACSDGVWYAAKAPAGPWSPATYVPAIVYTIPAGSPLYHVTFVHIYNARGLAQTAPQAVPTPKPEATYENFAPRNSRPVMRPGSITRIPTATSADMLRRGAVMCTARDTTIRAGRAGGIGRSSTRRITASTTTRRLRAARIRRRHSRWPFRHTASAQRLDRIRTSTRRPTASTGMLRATGRRMRAAKTGRRHLPRRQRSNAIGARGSTATTARRRTTCVAAVRPGNTTSASVNPDLAAVAGVPGYP
jgi:hypothetical protein